MWSESRAEAHLASHERFGMELGLARMQALLGVLGHPERAFRSVHVVGTNGKSSTARYAAGLLGLTGSRAGAYLSPHLVRWRERVQVDGRDLAAEPFAAAVQRVAGAAEGATQFEVLTAAAFVALADAGVEWAVVEAGLGGRLDATNVLGSEATVLTSVALEHTEHLGGTLAEIAREKLAVLRPGSVLVTGPLPGEAEREAATAAAALGARRIEVEGDPVDFRLTNAALARAVVAAVTETELVATWLPEVPGRLQVLARDPLTLLDGAHNPAGMVALAAALPAATEGRRPLVGLVSIVSDKDAAGMLDLLRPHLDALVLTRSANPRALAPEALATGGGEVVGDPRAALGRARVLAGPGGAVLATGSIHLVADLLAGEGSRAVTAY